MNIRLHFLGYMPIRAIAGSCDSYVFVFIKKSLLIIEAFSIMDAFAYAFILGGG